MLIDAVIRCSSEEVYFVMNKTFFYAFIKIFMTNKSIVEIIFTIISVISTLLGFICTYIDRYVWGMVLSSLWNQVYGN